MSNWIPLTEELALTRMAELSNLKNVKLPGGMTGDEVLAEQMAKLVGYIRGFCESAVKAGHLRALGAEGTVPQRLVDPSLAILRIRIATRLPAIASKLIDKHREEEAANAEELLKLMVSGKWSAEEDGEEETVVHVVSPSIHARRKQYGRHQQDGI